jgi:hypothetical protein
MENLVVDPKLKALRKRRNEASKRWRLRHPKERRAIQKSWRDRNPEKCKQYGRGNYQRRKATCIRASKRWRDNNKERCRKNRKAWQKANPYGMRMRKAKLELFDVMGNKCSECGFDDIRALQIHHIHNDGYAERKSGAMDNYLSFYHKVKKSFLNHEGKYTLFCANCNWIHKFEHHVERRKK